MSGVLFRDIMLDMQALRLYNSRTRKKEVFTARRNRVGMYVCGITPYGVTHLGHAFTYTFFDALGRVLRRSGYRTTYVQNLTDIDDDILKRSREEKRDWRELGEENAQKFLDDQTWLGNEPPDVYPRATDHIPEIIAMTKKLLRAGFAYEKNGSVYFDASRSRRYGAMARAAPRRMIALARERGGRPEDPDKKHPLDFILWQGRRRGEPSWPSPWGPGRPGWHIECSAMAGKCLGDTVDIHGGGGDLIFPHHESEEAQSSAAHGGAPLARWWVHTAMLKYHGEKMSKSLGNLVLVSDLKKHYGANAVRLYLLSRHYRDAFEFFERDVEAVGERWLLFQKVWRRQSGGGERLDPRRWERAFDRALADDMDTRRAIEVMEQCARAALDARGARNITDAKAWLHRAAVLLGLRPGYR